MEGKNYLDVQIMFREAGFTNIQLEAVDDLIVGWLHDEGDVKEVSIGGNTNYSSCKWYSTNTPVIIRYHVFPKDSANNNQNGGNPNTGSGNAGNGNNETQDEILTVDNCPELAFILSLKPTYHQSYIDSAQKYKGRTIQFDGCIVYLSLHEKYTTRYDILLSAGNYDPDSGIGPIFHFENVNAYNLDLDTLWLEDEIWVGRNVIITATVDEFDTRSELFYLDPISVVGR